MHMPPLLDLEEAGDHYLLVLKLPAAYGAFAAYRGARRIAVRTAVNIHHTVLTAGIEDRVHFFFPPHGAAAERAVPEGFRILYLCSHRGGAGTGGAGSEEREKENKRA
jgi:hypothetical protein